MAAIVLGVAMAILGEWIAREVSSAALRSAAISSSVFVESYLQPSVQGLVGHDLPQESKDRLDAALKETPLENRLVSVKIWLLDGMIVYATDKEVEGRTFPVDEVERAIRGEVVASYDELAGEESAREMEAGLPLIEVYAPLYRDGTGEIIAVGEYYEHAPWFGEALREAQRSTWLVVGVTTAGMLGLLFFIVRRGSRTILLQRIELQNRVVEAQSLAEQNRELRDIADSARIDATESNEQLISRVGSDIHDGPIQLLSMLMLKLSAPRSTDAGETDQTGPRPADRTDSLLELTRDILGELRDLSSGLSLPEIDRMSLREALQLAVSRHEDVTGARARLTVGDLPPEIPLALKTCAYRVVQEALTNSYKHAGCLDPEVSVLAERDLTIVVTDSGEGFDPRLVAEDGRRRLGLAGIRNRVRAFKGSLSIVSAPGEGSRITVCLPLASGEA